MLTKLIIRNFKRFGEVEIELGSPVVFIGPNNSGKTSAMQALALWDAGLKRWNEKRSGKRTPEKRPGVTVNRRDLVAIPVPDANLLWRGLHVRDVRQVDGKPRTSNIRIDLTVEGVSNDRFWTCGLEFDYANEESFYCRPLRKSDGKSPDRMAVPEEAGDTRIAFLPPMSGLAATETRLDSGAVNVRIGEGRTAEVLRNLCLEVHNQHLSPWDRLVAQIRSLFGVGLDPPRYVAARGEIAMTYREGRIQLDLSSAGRGLQQTLLLLAYMYANPGAVLLLDEPDAHLEILRQRQIYALLTDVARESGTQIIAASHSEVLLNQAAGRDMVVAFVGQPHRIDDRGSQVLKALRDIPFDQYYQAEQTGWVLYIEGSTDLSILQAFARRLGHDRASRALERPFVCVVENQPAAVRRHFHGLKEALPSLRGIALFDRIPRPELAPVECEIWSRREIENYLSSRATLEAYAGASAAETVPGPLFTEAEAGRRLEAMRSAIEEIESALATLDRGSPWDADIKASDEFLTPLFASYFKKLKVPNLMAKKSFYELADYVPDDEVDPEVRAKLDAIARVAEAAQMRAPMRLPDS
ncbi:MAG: AAA family ATPase [Spirochaetaceae bacterium]|nr:AAA family ATPase [Spirochaetaceae bacterium]